MKKLISFDGTAAFRYTFYLPRDSAETSSPNKRRDGRGVPVAILWDMESGFVRMSPLFKASGYANLSTKVSLYCGSLSSFRKDLVGKKKTPHELFFVLYRAHRENSSIHMASKKTNERAQPGGT